MAKKKKKQKKLNIKAAHRHFAVSCFNSAWDFIDLAERTPEEEEEMLRLSMASCYHWTQREDYSPTNASIANWQLSRVFSLMGQVENARRYGLRSLEILDSDDAPPFYVGYAYEALVRAEAVVGNEASVKEYLEKARQAAAQVEEDDDRQFLLNDLDAIQI